MQPILPHILPGRFKSLSDSVCQTLVMLSVMIIAGGGVVAAQSITDSTEVFFRQSHTELLPGFRDNAARIDSMAARLRLLTAADSAYTLKEVRVEGAASPEGTDRFNRWLSEQRADRIFDYFKSRTELPDSLTRFKFLGRDWRGLYAGVVADARVPYRREVLDILAGEGVLTSDGPAEGGDRLLARLKELHGGVAYRYMYDHIFPTLRYSRLFVEYERWSRMPLIGVSSDLHQAPDALAEFEFTGFPYKPAPAGRPFYMGLKTNMLCDVLAIPEIGAEFYLGRNWSVVANWMYGWWDNDSRHRYWRAYGGDIAVRRWFGRAAADKPLTGHHVGVYGGVVTFDFEFGGKGIMGGKPLHTLWDRCMRTAGIEYGYSLPVARRINIDFTVAIGYLGGKYVKYQPAEGAKGYEWLSTHNLNWFGPTKLEVSLVWLIGHGNYNVRK